MRRQPPNERLRDYRTSKRLSLDELAEKIGCAKGHLSMVIAGIRTPGLRLAFGIERAVGIDAEEWVRRAG